MPFDGKIYRHYLSELEFYARYEDGFEEAELTGGIRKRLGFSGMGV